MARSAARRYAEAIVDLARENHTFDVWDRDLGKLAGALRNADLATFVSNPSIPVAEKRKALGMVLGGDQPHKETENLVRLLLERHRIQDLPAIYDLFSEAWLKEQGIALAYVTTAEPVTPEDERAIREQLRKITGKKIELRLSVDPSLIGGMVARIGDTLIDGSVQSKLRALRQRLSSVPV